MLIDVGIKNFRSIYEVQNLSMYREARGAKQAQPEGWIRPDLLPVTAIYGANAAGKSTLVEAIRFISDAVEDSYRDWPVDGGVPRAPFALHKSAKSEPSEFDIEFVAADGLEYRFGFAVDDSAVVSEYLHLYRTRRKTVLYERDGDDWRFGDAFRGPASQIRLTTRANSLFISAAAAAGNLGTSAPYEWLVKQLRVYSAPGYLVEHRRVATMVQEDEIFRSKLLAFLANADLGVTDIQVGREELDPDFKEFILRTMPSDGGKTVDEVIADAETNLVLTHRGRDGSASLPFDTESDGTHALISFASIAVQALESGAVCIVDEIDSSLHPLLVAELIRVFADPQLNRKQAQLIFTTHDVSLLRPASEGQAALSRDEIWVVEKASDGASSLVALSEYAPRATDNLERGYLTGRFGGLPTLSLANNLLSRDL